MDKEILQINQWSLCHFLKNKSMPVYKEEFLKTIWDAVKKGARLSHVMATYNCDKREAIEMYDQACKLYGRGPKKEKVQTEKPVIPDKKQEWKRPEAQYSNSGYFQTLNKYN